MSGSRRQQASEPGPLIYPSKLPTTPIVFNEDHVFDFVRARPNVFRPLVLARQDLAGVDPEDLMTDVQVGKVVALARQISRLMNYMLVTDSGGAIFIDRTSRPLRRAAHEAFRALGLSGSVTMLSMDIGRSALALHSDMPVVRELRRDRRVRRLDPHRPLIVIDEVLQWGDSLKNGERTVKALFPKAEVHKVIALADVGLAPNRFVAETMWTSVDTERVPAWWSAQLGPGGEKNGLLSTDTRTRRRQDLKPDHFFAQSYPTGVHFLARPPIHHQAMRQSQQDTRSLYAASRALGATIAKFSTVAESYASLPIAQRHAARNL